MAKQQDLTVFSGDDVTLRFTVLDEAGSVLDITGAQKMAFAMSRKAPVNKSPLPEVLLIKNLTSGITIVTPTAGRANIDLDKEDLEPLDGYYYYEVRFVDVAGQHSTLAFGRIQVSKNLITNVSL